ncbi:hypothetical protein TorRG33x02_228100, partial [Trema orientale]
MARAYLIRYTIDKHSHLPFSCTAISLFSALVVTLSIFSLIAFLCASNKSNKSHKKIVKKDQITVSTARRQSSEDDGKFVSRLNSTKAFSMARIISWRKVQADDHEEDDHTESSSDDEEVWRKTIMRGERCRPLEFSGKIIRVPILLHEGRHSLCLLQQDDVGAPVSLSTVLDYLFAEGKMISYAGNNDTVTIKTDDASDSIISKAPSCVYQMNENTFFIVGTTGTVDYTNSDDMKLRSMIQKGTRLRALALVMVDLILGVGVTAVAIVGAKVTVRAEAG